MLGTTNMLECLMYIVLVEILHSIQHYKETKKVKQVIFWTELVDVPSETKAKALLSWSYLLIAGIISAIAFCPAHTGMLATGSYSQTTAIYREDNMELLYVLHGQEGGVTQVSEHLLSFTWFYLWYQQGKAKCFHCFSPFIQVQFSKDGNYLYTGARKVTYCTYSSFHLQPMRQKTKMFALFWFLVLEK